jgi:hypothetical protein
MYLKQAQTQECPMNDFDPTRRIVMAKFKTVLGHSLPAGTPLAIVEEPSARGEVDEAMARRLFAAKIAVYAAPGWRPRRCATPDQAALTKSSPRAIWSRGRPTMPRPARRPATRSRTTTSASSRPGKGPWSRPTTTRPTYSGRSWRGALRPSTTL